MKAGNLKPVTTVAQLRESLRPLRQGNRIALVPTMGALHEGHLSLVRAAEAECDVTVVSIYVNPSQFGPGEDLDKYPRTLAADVAALQRCGVDLLFVPADSEVYCKGHATWIEVGGPAQPLEGQCRPGHFRGVATIVLKLFAMVQPEVAYFGQKDYQQATVIRQMVRDLNVPVEIRVCPTVREPDGLAMSSRNVYLTPAGRQRALVLWRSLQLAAELVERGEREAGIVARRMRDVLHTAEDAQIDYLAIVHPHTLTPLDTITGPTLVALAVRIDNVRLIDNQLLVPK